LLCELLQQKKIVQSAFYLYERCDSFFFLRNNYYYLTEAEAEEEDKMATSN